MNHRIRAAVFGVLGLTAFARAADVLDVSPLVNDRTMLVARIDVTSLKLPAVVTWARALLTDEAKLAPQDIQQMMMAPAAGAMVAQPTVEALKRAGVTQATLIVAIDEAGMRREPLPILAIDTPDADAVTNALKPLNMVATEVAGLTVWTPANRAGELIKIAPSPRPDLIDAVSNTDGAAVVAAVAISEAVQTETKRDWPQGPPTGFAPAVSPFENAKAYRVRIEANPPHATLALDAKDAKAVETFLKEQENAKRDRFRDQFWNGLIKALPTKIEGNTVTADLRKPEFAAVARALVPAIANAKTAAERVKSASNLRQLMLGCIMYANENRNAVPPTLDVLGKYLGNNAGVPAAVLTNPQRPDLKDKGYVYVPAKEGKTGNVPADRLAIYEAGDWKEGKNVAFWDGHVEWVSDKAQFEKLLADAEPAKP